MYYEYFTNVDLLGKVIHKTKSSHPYSYDTFCYYLNGDIKETTSTIYSDYLFKWNPEKYNKLCMKYFNNHGQVWSNRNIETIELFLSEYLDIGDKKVTIIAMSEGCNVSNGYPLWVMNIKY